MQNGRPDPLDGWEIWLVEGRALIGKPALVGLSPVYELIVQVQVARDGLAKQIGCAPILWFPSIRAIEIRGTYPKIPLSDLSSEDRKQLSHSILQADEFIRTARAAEAGILVANKLPPVKT